MKGLRLYGPVTVELTLDPRSVNVEPMPSP